MLQCSTGMLQTIASPVRGLQLYFIVLPLFISMQTHAAQDEVAEPEQGSCLMQSVLADAIARGTRKLEKINHEEVLHDYKLNEAIDEATGDGLSVEISQSYKANEQLDSASEPIVQQQSENTSKISQGRLRIKPLATEPTPDAITTVTMMDTSIQREHAKISSPELANDSSVIVNNSRKQTFANLTTIEKTDVSSHTGGFSTDSLITVADSAPRQITEGMRNIEFFEAELQNRINQAGISSGHLISYVGRALCLLTSPDQAMQSVLTVGAAMLIIGVISVVIFAVYHNDFEDHHEGIVVSGMANDALVKDASRSPVEMPLQMPPVNVSPSGSNAGPIRNSQLSRQPGSNLQAPVAPTASREPGPVLVDQSPSDHAAGGKYLCPELVVPPEGECCLLMPKVPPHVLQALRPRSAFMPPMSGKDCQISITDMKGVAMLQAIFHFPNSASHPNVDNPQKGRILLCKPGEDKHVFGHLTEAQSMESNDRSVLTLHDHKGRVFGSLRAEVGDMGIGYTYSACNGSKMYFSGDFKFDSVHGSSTQAQGLIFDGHRDLQAFVKPRVLDQSSRSVRVGPLADIGCVLLCLLGIDMLEL